MLRKICKIRNVGKFQKVDAAGDVQLRPITLIFAENARGKTTLCDILRSIKTNNVAFIKGRHTLGATENSEIELLFDSGKVAFRNGSLTEAHPEIEIFDITFVHENVYAGDYVDHEHKRKLYHVILGEKGVRLAQEIDELDKTIRKVDKSISESKAALVKVIPEGISLDDFLNFSADERIDEHIQKAEINLDALRRTDEIRRKDLLTQITLPLLPANFLNLLSRKLEDVTLDAEKLVRSHIIEHTRSNVDERRRNAIETWVFDGVQYIQNEMCPFCGQSIDSLDLVKAYRVYFGQSYNDLQSKVESVLQQLQSTIGATAELQIRQAYSNNKSLYDFWSKYISGELSSLNIDEVIEVLKQFSETAQGLVRQKLDSLLKSVEPKSDFVEQQKRLEAMRQKIVAYNESITAINALINSKKKDVEVADLAEAELQLKRFKTKKIRHEAIGVKACTQYREFCTQKEALEKQKTDNKGLLDEYSNQTLGKFEKRINQLLEHFGASFRIDKTQRQYVGGRTSSTYRIVINNVGVELGSDSTDVSKPCFRNTLSAGDRSTLAFAFFVAQLEIDERLHEKIVILDDPFSSQDTFRRTCTKQRICKLSNTCKQVIVLSHEPNFLRLVWDDCDRSNRKSLQITRMGNTSTITEWNIEGETRDAYFQQILILKKYVDGGEGDHRHVAQTIRPVLEGYLMGGWPNSFGENEWLGDYIKKIREAREGEPLHNAQQILTELEDINEYSKRFHHSDNHVASNERIDETELGSFVKRTLFLVNAC